MFTQKVNLTIFILVFVLVLFENKLPWDTLTSFVYIITFVVLLKIVYQPPKRPIQYFTLVEGEIGKCNSFDGIKNESANMVLLEHKCRISPIGCWLVFSSLSAGKDNMLTGQLFRNRMTMFVPKHHLPLPDYKSLCRHIIWHSGLKVTNEASK